jgi:hypothetical protein
MCLLEAIHAAWPMYRSQNRTVWHWRQQAVLSLVLNFHLLALGGGQQSARNNFRAVVATSLSPWSDGGCVSGWLLLYRIESPDTVRQGSTMESRTSVLSRMDAQCMTGCMVTTECLEPLEY